MEFFAGDANVTWAMRQWGLAGIALDYSYGGRFNNIFEPAGFASLAQFIHQFFVETLRKLSCSQGPLKMLIFFLGWALRLAILAILRLHPNGLIILAPVCSSMSFMCCSQAERFWYSPLGNEKLHWVKAGNVMSCRVVLLAYLAMALGHTFIVEQPSSAKFGDMPRWRHFVEDIVYDTWFS